MGYFYRTVFLGYDIALFLPDPDWKNTVDITYRLKTRVDAGKTGREERKARHYVIRHEQRARWVLDASDTADLQAALINLDTAFIGVPIFPDVLPPSRWAERIHDAAWVLNYDETGYAIYSAEALPVVPARKFLAPLLVGRRKERPKLTLSNTGDAQFDLTIVERSPRDFAIAPAPQAVGSDWPEVLDADWSQLPEDSTEDSLIYEDLGDGRLEAVGGVDGVTRRRESFALALTNRTEIRTLLNFFAGRRGRVRSFAAPWLSRPGDDTPETPHATQARFADDDFTIQYQTGEVGRTKLSFVQLPWEIEGVQGEAPEQESDAYLYRFSIDVPGGPIVWRYTNWEADIARQESGQHVTYLGDTKGLIEHDKIVRTTDLFDEPTAITSYIFDTNPLLRIVQRMLDVPLAIEILRVDPSNPANAEVVYTGEVGEVENDGRKLKAETHVFGGLLELKVPNFYFGPVCNYQFCGDGCNQGNAMPPDHWTLTGTVQSVDGAEVDILVTSNPSGAALSEDWLSRGWLKKGEGEAFEIRKIVRSYDLGAGRQKLVLKKALRAVAAGDTVALRPYCSGTKTECQEKYNNYINFGGHPHIGAQNLTVPQKTIDSSGGGKK